MKDLTVKETNSLKIILVKRRRYRLKIVMHIQKKRQVILKFKE